MNISKNLKMTQKREPINLKLGTNLLCSDFPWIQKLGY